MTDAPSAPFAPRQIKPYCSQVRSTIWDGAGLPPLATQPLGYSAVSVRPSAALPEDEVYNVAKDPNRLPVVHTTGSDNLNLDVLPHGLISDPHATRYVPTITRALTTTDPHQHGIESYVWHQHRSWTKPFRAGSVAEHSSVRKSYARAVVAAGPWDGDTISELAGKFSERAANAHDDSLAYIAPFAREISECFHVGLGQAYAHAFDNQLRYCILTEFRAWWSPGQPTSIVRLPLGTFVPSAGRLSSALAVATIIGDLFAYGLAPGYFVIQCLEIILDKLSVIEEVSALHAIINRSGRRLHEYVSMKKFIANVEARAARLPVTASAVGRIFVRSELQCYIKEMMNPPVEARGSGSSCPIYSTPLGTQSLWSPAGTQGPHGAWNTHLR